MTAAETCAPVEVSRQRILYVLSCWPHDQAYGGQIRALQVARALARKGKVTLAIVGADPVLESVKVRTAEEFDLAGEWPVQSTGIHGLGALIRSLFAPEFVNIHGVALDEASEKHILALMKSDADLVWFFQLRTANYFMTANWPDAVVDVDNLPSASATSTGEGTSLSVSRLAARLRTWQLRRHERRLAKRFGVVAVCSDADRRTLGADGRLLVIPNGFDMPVVETARAPSNPPRIGFIGLLEYEPNRDGVRWFLAHCWPALRQAVPGIRLRLAGKGGGRVVNGSVDGVDILGWIDDAGAEMATWSLTVIPIFSGAGTRIKVAEAFSRRCPVVATPLGAYGYEVEDGRELRLGDTPEAFVSACLDLLRDPVAAAAMTARAWEAYVENWSWDAVAPRVWEAVEEAFRHRRSRGAESVMTDRS
ncbi:sugar transferase, PEP-CTERM/EpsH1 system associated [Luteitalea pratensis]|uniref:Sugar transferase, PEP-CTERM/EpsH1 system associated n=1 Tax=Luteitalea pratensis TaxID=1855912 RepID=A0A143PX78_LUTPR|nr:glycosyltransferase family 4 protein [Luteitalea pratensis]AMY12971.1 sugar transferase, PEP-CTERM/EpsH1 system associated [Luteitalea pratensis]